MLYFSVTFHWRKDMNNENTTPEQATTVSNFIFDTAVKMMDEDGEDFSKAVLVEVSEQADRLIARGKSNAAIGLLQDGIKAVMGMGK